MGIAQAAAPEITRLIIGVNRRVGPKHGGAIHARAADIGLDSIDLLPGFAELLLDGLLSKEIAQLRMRYMAPDQVLARLDELESKGLIAFGPAGYRATDALRPLLKAMRSAVADVAADLWRNKEVEVSVATEAANALRAAITPEHVVAAAHAKVRPPIDRYSMLEQRLETLRYIRQHDHAAAWIDRNLTAREIVVMTRLWRGEEVDGADEPVRSLRDAGYVKKSDPLQLTAKGLKVRQAIEDDTNVRTDRAFAVLDDEQAPRFLEALRNLPG